MLSITGCGEAFRYYTSGEVGWALKHELRDNRNREIELTKLTKFEWDELFLFAPYTQTSEICKTMNLAQPACISIQNLKSIDEGEMPMVFRHRGKIVHTEMHFRWHGDFTPVPTEPLTPVSAVFTVTVEGKGANGGDWLMLHRKSH